MIDHQFYIVNVNYLAWYYALKHDDEMSHYKCRPKYWSEFKDTEDQAGVKFHKWSELNNQINYLASIQFPKD